MSKLPNVFHNNEKYITNNKNTFNTFDKSIKKEIESNAFNGNNIINFFNKKITVELKDGRVISGVLLSKRDNVILLDTEDYININEIMSIK